TSQVSVTPVVIDAAPPTFNPTTGQVGPGTTILGGSSQQTVYGTLGTTAVLPGANGQYVEALSTAAASELEAAIAMFGANPSALAGFGSVVSVTGGFASIATSVLT